jgi:hypothetical protein
VDRLDGLSIRWSFSERDGTRHDAGTTRHLVYLLFATPTDSWWDYGSSKGAQSTTPFLSVIDLGTAQAHGAGGAGAERAVVDRIFSDFADRAVHRRTFDSATGTVSLDADTLFYYWKTRPWTIEERLVGAYPTPPCGTTEALLRSGSSGGGLCDAWAHFFADTLSAQGIRSVRVSPAQERGWKALVPRDAEFMLIAPWEFRRPDPRRSGSGAYPYYYRVRYQSSGSVVGTGNLAFRGPVPEAFRGQGPQLFPPGLFGVAAHALVRYPAEEGGRLFDPSYGKRSASIAAWARESLAGWARLEGDGGDFRCDKGAACVLLARKLPA